ncbi:unnamed protein product [Heligmosomoides polygyrus]|uniref:Uncharacterized protein n=1 Tax=Heligmosomoides polygyrus TaxID=6339 RepID=A0A3P8B8G7_HELPZ|nr:unnamed protein product [Heligmosomoides polygyrus]
MRFQDSGAKGSLRVFFSVGEKTNVEPAAVATYNYSVNFHREFLDYFFELQDWVVSAQSYGGYTGGAMFVMGVFALVLGVGIGAGGVFFVTKRQRISTLAYQVFE